MVNEVYKKFDPIDYFKGTTATKIYNILICCLFVVGTCLVMLLQQDLLPTSEQRLVAVTILHELYRGEPIANTPFVNVFIQLLVRDI